MTVTILQGDCREVLLTMPDKSVHCCVTSPPYFGLRDYGHAGQIGMEDTPDHFVAEMVAVFREVHRVLRDDGTLWLNLGDSYSRAAAKGGSGPNGKNEENWGYGENQKSRVVNPNSKQASNRHADLDHLPRSAKIGTSDGIVGRAERPGTRARGFRPGSGRADGIVDERGQRNRDGVGPVPGLKEKNLIGIPWRVAFALQADGWYLRQDIIWSKPNPMPESVTDRCTKAHEYIFLMSKSARYRYDGEAIAEPAVKAGQVLHSYGTAAKDRQDVSDVNDRRTRIGLANWNQAQPDTRNKRSVWTVSTQAYGEAHFATFPPALVEPCILAGCPVGGTVLDPFGGAGTTGLVADRLGRDAVLIELNHEYAAMAQRRIEGDAGMFAQVFA